MYVAHADLNLTNRSILNISKDKIINPNNIILSEAKWSFHSTPLTNS
ncbi:MAG: hypothetical protein J07HQW2_00512 [Haloquadratum walsbyi J07HQW2]|uniref:Uncharacterized protein n=1 Tax=Haloquadratum walsbyi J07HQW2 TaxID=1238425 RepID=U1NBP6_9EURY|nr:MAG: hypothetical protein J07HQW2_00512 [Haloquadratum walsbyi J07HQW2]